jgi:hypothetical protein
MNTPRPPDHRKPAGHRTESYFRAAHATGSAQHSTSSRRPSDSRSFSSARSVMRTDRPTQHCPHTRIPDRRPTAPPCCEKKQSPPRSYIRAHRIIGEGRGGADRGSGGSRTGKRDTEIKSLVHLQRATVTITALLRANTHLVSFQFGRAVDQNFLFDKF